MNFKEGQSNLRWWKTMWEMWRGYWIYIIWMRGKPPHQSTLIWRFWNFFHPFNRNFMCFMFAMTYSLSLFPLQLHFVKLQVTISNLATSKNLFVIFKLFFTFLAFPLWFMFIDIHIRICQLKRTETQKWQLCCFWNWNFCVFTSRIQN